MGSPTIGIPVDTTMPPDEVLATAEQIAGMPRRSVRDLDGVTDRVLWTSGTQVAGVMEFAPGATMPEHTHVDRSHHIWVAAGSVSVDGQQLTAGGYAHVPAGVPHEVGAGAEGGTLFYVFTT
jgi:quercetin dioxygenase-like cupin family protein